MEGDLDFVLRTERDEENRLYVGQWTRERHRDALADGDVAHMILERAKDASPVGYVVLLGLNEPDGSIDLKRLVVTEKGFGYGRTALRLVENFAFEELGAHRLWFGVKEHNARARRLYETEGFVVEGVLRECLRQGDGYESLVVMSILESEYRA
jgi:RimJ/RimL family protein N-acetyltransferase